MNPSLDSGTSYDYSIAFFWLRKIFFDSHVERIKSLYVFSRVDESLHHLRACIVTFELVEFCQPKVIASEIQCGFWRIVWVAMEIPKVLHQNKSAVELYVPQSGVFCCRSQCAGRFNFGINKPGTLREL